MIRNFTVWEVGEKNGPLVTFLNYFPGISIVGRKGVDSRQDVFRNNHFEIITFITTFFANPRSSARDEVECRKRKKDKFE